MPLTPHQQTIYNQIQVLLASDGPGVFILKGYAGTGKTFLLQYLAEQLTKQKKKFTLLASTGRAAAVLRAKTEFTATTVHSELYHFYDVEGDDENLPDNATVDQFGQMKLLFGLRSKDKADEEKIYIVDEASMISNVPGDETSYARFGSGLLLYDLMNTVGINKIIFSGDPCQLPPVFQQDSPALSEYWFRENKYPVTSATLTEIIRHQSGSGILQLATEVRNMVHNMPGVKWIKLPAKNIQQVTLLPHQLMKERYRAYTDKHGFDHAIAVCNSNFNCHDINDFIREHRYGNANAPLQIGDILMVTQNNYIVPLVNGDFVEIVNIGNSQLHAGFNFTEVTVSAKHNNKKHQILLCMEVLFGSRPNLLPEQQKTLMIDFSMKMRKKGIGPKSEKYKQLLKSDPYLNSLRANFGYAVTCHKSQGGEWDHVFLFLHKGMYMMEKENLIRWWYTGITRAKENLYLTDDWWIN